MAKRKKNAQRTETTGATVGYKAQLWPMADALRGLMDAAEYKHVVLGLIFLKYISDAFEEPHAKLEAGRAQGADPEDPDEYRAQNVFWVPPEARWAHLKAQARQPTIGRLVDDAMAAIERDNSALKGVLPKDYAHPALDKTRLGQLIDLVSNIRFRPDQPSPGASRHPLPEGEGRSEGNPEVAVYSDIPGFCKSATLEEVRKHGHVLIPGRYVGAEAQADDLLPAPRPGVYVVYTIACEGGSYYIGHTDDLPRRWQEHVSGQGADGTKKNRPRYIAHYEEFTSREAAVMREQELKTTAGRRWLKQAIAEGRARQAGGEPFEDKMKRLVAQLREQQAQARRLDEAIWRNLEDLGYDA